MKSRIIIITSAIALLIIGLVGMSYAYLRTTVTQTDTNAISTLNCLSVTLTGLDSAISITNDFPVSDATGITRTPYTFRITNNCNSYVSANINLESLNVSNKLSRNYVKASINEVGSTPIVIPLTTNNTTATIANAESNTLLNVSLDDSQTKDFELRLWIDYNTTWEQGNNKNYQAKIVIIAQAILPPNTWANPHSGTLLYAIKNNPTTVVDTNCTTTPGRTSATTNEGICTAPDDYGTSYYYRGDIDNNFIVFAGKCWRIVRVDGNGNIKIVLYNNSGSSCENTGTSDAFSHTSQIFNTSHDKAGYVGFMYGNTLGSSYENEFNNQQESNVLTQLKSWYTSTFSTTQRELLADVVWCNDKKVTSGNGYASPTYFAAYDRINVNGNAATQAAPSFACQDAVTSGTNEVKNYSRYTAGTTVDAKGNGALTIGGVEYKIGLLTADEVAYAGLAYNGVADSTVPWIMKNATGDLWWTSSPSVFSVYGAGVWDVSTSGYLYTDSVIITRSLRPAVSLKSGVSITTASETNKGTATNPYVVVES